MYNDVISVSLEMVWSQSTCSYHAPKDFKTQLDGRDNILSNKLSVIEINKLHKNLLKLLSNVDKTWPKTKNCSKLYWYKALHP